jgi:hypothetical protein
MNASRLISIAMLSNFIFYVSLQNSNLSRNKKKDGKRNFPGNNHSSPIIEATA